MESQAISRDSQRSTAAEAMKGKVVGPAPNGTALLVEVAGQTIQAQGDPETSAGTPVLLRLDSDGTWKAAPIPKGVPEALRQELWQALSQFLESPAAASQTPQGKELRRAVQEFQKALGGRGDAVLSSAQEMVRILRQGVQPEGAPELLDQARKRPVLLKVTSPDGKPVPSGTNFLEITGSAGPEPQHYSARLGGRTVQIQGPEGMNGNLGLWETWSSEDTHWLTPTRTQAAPQVPELPATVDLTENAITGFLQRLLPESHTASSPALTKETRAFATLLHEVLTESAASEADQGPPPRREIDVRTLLRLLDAWSQDGPEAEAFPEADQARLQRLLAGQVSRSTAMEESVTSLLALAKENTDDLPALSRWIRQNLSKITHPHFPLGTGEDDPLKDLALSLAKDLSALPADATLRPQLREAAQELLGGDLRSRQDPQGTIQLPWLQPQPQGMHEGALRVLDRRRNREHDPQQRTRVAITMQPPLLGKVDASLELVGTTLRVELASAESATGSLIRQHLPELEKSLKTLGLEPSLAVTRSEPGLSARPAVPASRPRLDLQA